MDTASNDSYDSLPMKDFNEEELPFLGTIQRQEKKSRKKAFLLWLPNILIFSASIAMVTFSILRTPTDAQCDQVLSPYCEDLFPHYGLYHSLRWQTDLCTQKPPHLKQLNTKRTLSRITSPSRPSFEARLPQSEKLPGKI